MLTVQCALYPKVSACFSPLYVADQVCQLQCCMHTAQCSAVKCSVMYCSAVQ